MDQKTAKKIVLHSDIITPVAKEDRFPGGKNLTENLPEISPATSEKTTRLAYEVAKMACSGIDTSKLAIL